MERTYKITKIAEDGSRSMLTQIFHNALGAFENAVTFNMILHGVNNVADPILRYRFLTGVSPARTINPRDMAFISYHNDVYCVSEVFESEMPLLALGLNAVTNVN